MDIQFAPQRRTKTTTRAQETIVTIALSKTSKSQLLIWLINNKRKIYGNNNVCNNCFNFIFDFTMREIYEISFVLIINIIAIDFLIS